MVKLASLKGNVCKVKKWGLYGIMPAYESPKAVMLCLVV